MSGRTIPSALVVAWALALPLHLAGQTVPRTLEALPAGIAEAWVRPLPRVLGPTLTSGFFADARPAGFHLGVHLSLGRFAGEDEGFVPPLPASVSFEGTSYAEPYALAGGPASPTVAGSGPGAALVPRPGSDFEAALVGAGHDPASHRIPLPEGAGLTGTPVPSVDVNLGLGSAAAVTGRFFPRLDLDDDLGDIGGFGAAALVAIDRWVPLPVFDAALTLGTQKVEIGGYLDASATASGMILSRDLGPARVHVHGQRVRWQADVRWTSRNPGGVAGLPPDGAVQRLRFGPETVHHLAIGTSLDLPGGGLSVELSASEPRVLSGHLTLGSR